MPNDDYIKRSDVRAYVCHAYAKGLNLMEYIDEIPSADVEPKREIGFWIDHKVWIDYENNIRETIRCSLCNNLVEIKYIKNYCSNCGAKMKGI